MKRLVILIGLSSPAFAHQVPFADKNFLAINKDPAKAHAIKDFCDEKRLGYSACKDKFSGSGNLAVEAVTKCETDNYINALKLSYNFNTKDFASRAHKVFGSVWHADIRDGHGHTYSEVARQLGANSSFNKRLTEINNSNTSFKGTRSDTSGHSMSGGFETGVPGALSVNFNFGGDKSTSITASQITQEQIADLKQAWLAGWNNPDKFGFEPDGVVGPEGKLVTGEKPAPEKTEKDATTKTTEGKKGADTSEGKKDEKVAETFKTGEGGDIKDNESTSGGTIWTGNETTGAPDEVVATPTFEDLALQSPLEKCVEEETKRLNDELGKKLFDPNATADNHEENERAKSLFQHGYCDEQIMGREFCRAKKFKEDSIVAIDIQTARKEAAASALNQFKMTGQCDSNALGREFCKKQRDKWLVNPAERVTSPTRSPLGPIRGAFPRTIEP